MLIVSFITLLKHRNSDTGSSQETSSRAVNHGSTSCRWRSVRGVWQDTSAGGIDDRGSHGWVGRSSAAALRLAVDVLGADCRRRCDWCCGAALRLAVDVLGADCCGGGDWSSGGATLRLAVDILSAHCRCGGGGYSSGGAALRLAVDVLSACCRCGSCLDLAVGDLRHLWQSVYGSNQGQKGDRVLHDECRNTGSVEILVYR